MRNIGLILILATIILFGCHEKNDNIESTSHSAPETKTINVEFVFNSNKPSFGELYLITGSEDSKFPIENRQFEKLNSLGVSFIDGAYYGIKNDNKIGDGVTLWLFPMKKGSVEYVNINAPFDSVLMEYNVLGNREESIELVKEVFNSFKNNLDVKIVFDGKEINDFRIVENKIKVIVEVCKAELEIGPGSEEALTLLWRDTPLYNND